MMRGALIYTLCGFLVLASVSFQVYAANTPRKMIIPEEYRNIRDPFRQPFFASVENRQKTEIERYQISEFKLVAVMTGPKKLRAMVLAPNGKNYFLGLRDKIGNRDGIVKKIQPDGMMIQEKIVNAIGDEEKVMTELKFSAGLDTGGAPESREGTERHDGELAPESGSGKNNEG